MSALTREERELVERARATLAALGPAEPAQDLADRISRSVAAASRDAAPAFWERWVRVAWPAAVCASVAAAVLVLVMLRSGSAPAEAGHATEPTTEMVIRSIDDATSVVAMEGEQ